jgi:hypothetical protein
VLGSCSAGCLYPAPQRGANHWIDTITQIDNTDRTRPISRLLEQT